MPHPGEDHRDAMLVGGSNNFVVLDRAAGLDDRFGATVGGFVEAIAKWIKGIRGDRRAFEIEPMGGGAQHGDLGRIDAAHLAGSDAEHLVRRCEHDGVRFYVTADAPGEIEGAILILCRLSFSYDFALAFAKGGLVLVVVQRRYSWGGLTYP